MTNRFTRRYSNEDDEYIVPPYESRRVTRENDKEILAYLERLYGPVADLHAWGRMYVTITDDGKVVEIFDSIDDINPIGIPVYVEHCYPDYTKLPSLNDLKREYFVPTKKSAPIGRVINGVVVGSGELWVLMKFDVSGMDASEEATFRTMLHTNAFSGLSICCAYDKDVGKLDAIGGPPTPTARVVCCDGMIVDIKEVSLVAKPDIKGCGVVLVKAGAKDSIAATMEAIQTLGDATTPGEAQQMPAMRVIGEATPVADTTMAVDDAAATPGQITVPSRAVPSAAVPQQPPSTASPTPRTDVAAQQQQQQQQQRPVHDELRQQLAETRAMMLVNASGNKMRHDEALKVVTNLNQEAFKTMYDMFSSLASKTATPAPAAMPAPTPPAPAPVPDQSSTRAVAPMSKINMRPLGRQQDQMSDTQAPPGGRVVTGATTGRVSGLELTNTDRPNQIGQELADTLDGYPESYANDPRMAEDLAALVMRVVTGATGGY